MRAVPQRGTKETEDSATTVPIQNSSLRMVIHEDASDVRHHKTRSSWHPNAFLRVPWCPAWLLILGFNCVDACARHLSYPVPGNLHGLLFLLWHSAGCRGRSLLLRLRQARIGREVNDEHRRRRNYRLPSHGNFTPASASAFVIIAAFRVTLLDKDPIMPMGVVTTQPDRSPRFQITPR